MIFLVNMVLFESEWLVLLAISEPTSVIFHVPGGRLSKLFQTLQWLGTGYREHYCHIFLPNATPNVPTIQSLYVEAESHNYNMAYDWVHYWSIYAFYTN
ncbi:hypothetical protein RSOLAG1IB_01706 [Rhizoctonia solani AG-1 IB]|uniref:Uncharacterized protein n=1 Tax=Thanatephorus cucumeris (strain AG1-IB / isolate 7/3/14) TaxID=1108050 RepID=A0A0B7FFM7_THACB|nr:hypothetical protein RSOLAG1IB_01706 [Rhizoctonia solani AG-1 IB]